MDFLCKLYCKEQFYCACIHYFEHEAAESWEKQRETCLQPSSLCLLIAFQLAVHILYGFPPHVLLHHLHRISAFSMQGLHIYLCSLQILPMSYANALLGIQG